MRSDKTSSINLTKKIVKKDVDLDSFVKPICFPIVGVGASAGGLEACEALFASLPADCGMSFVVVVHLDPTHVSLMSALLQKKSTLPVKQVEDGLDDQDTLLPAARFEQAGWPTGDRVQ